MTDSNKSQPLVQLAVLEARLDRRGRQFYSGVVRGGARSARVLVMPSRDPDSPNLTLRIRADLVEPLADALTEFAAALRREAQAQAGRVTQSEGGPVSALTASGKQVP